MIVTLGNTDAARATKAIHRRKINKDTLSFYFHPLHLFVDSRDAQLTHRTA